MRIIHITGRDIERHEVPCSFRFYIASTEYGGAELATALSRQGYRGGPVGSDGGDCRYCSIFNGRKKLSCNGQDGKVA